MYWVSWRAERAQSTIRRRAEVGEAEGAARPAAATVGSSAPARAGRRSGRAGQAHRRRDEVGGEGLEIGAPRGIGPCRRRRSAADRDGIGQGAAARRPAPPARRAGMRPGGQHGVEEGPALRALSSASSAVPRKARRTRPLGTAARLAVRRVRQAAGSRRGARHRARSTPRSSRPVSRSRDESGLDRGLEPVRVGEGADREGRRQPGQQAGERVVSIVGMAVALLSVVVPAGRVGAASGRTGARRRATHGAEAAHHGDQDVIVADAERAVGRHLHRQMAVAEMPGDPRRLRSAAALDHRLAAAAHRETAAAVEASPSPSAASPVRRGRAGKAAPASSHRRRRRRWRSSTAA